jgi:DNA helicase HerA-like ATPase
VTEAPDLHESVDRYRAVRKQLEEQVLPLATSVDGRRFSYQTSLFGLEVQAGSYVALEQGSERRLGQIVTLEVAQRPTLELGASGPGEPAHRAQVVVRAAEGEGRVLSGDGSPFHDATVRPATADEIRDHLEETAPRRARLQIGELLLAPGVPFALDAGGFGRHTFLCGQSGSGKTYSLGLVLEQLLLETELRIVVLDPNSDYKRLGELRPDADEAETVRYAAATRSLAVRRAGDGLALLMAELEPATQAAALRLDPIADREEYAELAALTDGGQALTLEQLEQLGRDGGAGGRLIERARNLGLHRWGIWAGSERQSLLPELGRDDPRCLVVDLGSLATREEQALTAAGVLGELWRLREERKPVLIVVDEAHNVCPARPDDPLTAIATEYAVRIAGEGRKFGLYLLVSTQRPQKVHENVLSQCDNLLLMRMNSLADLGYVGEVFSFVPPSLLERATTFRQGESLAAGLIAPHAAFLRFGRRLAQEGGGDVPADWARRKAAT